MMCEGTVVNGVVVLDGDAPLPKRCAYGWRMEEDHFDDVSPPPITETHEEHLAILRQSIGEAQAGAGGIEARQFLKDLAKKHNLPLQPGE